MWKDLNRISRWLTLEFSVAVILSSTNTHTGHSRIHQPETRCSALLTMNRNGFLLKVLSERNEHIFEIQSFVCALKRRRLTNTYVQNDTIFLVPRPRSSLSGGSSFGTIQGRPCCAVSEIGFSYVCVIIAGMMRCSFGRACIIETGGHPNAPAASAMAKTPMMHSLFMLFWLPLLSICQCSFGQGTSLD